MKNKDIISDSYLRHKKHQEQLVSNLDVNNNVWIDKNNYDYWRHNRMYSFVDPLINKKDRWLTVGDCMGTDANYLAGKGVSDVLATDISDVRLKIAKKSFKFINKFKSENAENLSFKDNEFDFVLCKESLHHFPRPMLAIYELIRVSEKGVVLIEPNDARAFKNKRYVNHFESVGNYVYSLSVREVEKVTNSIALPGIAYKGFDDIYLSNGGSVSIDKFSLKVMLCKVFLFLLDIAKNIGIRDSSLVCVVIFKKKPNKNTLNKLVSNGFNIIVNRQNPFI